MQRISFSLALLSVSLIAYQIVLMSVLSLVQWYHFASMVISVALLGFGASGTFLTLTRTWCLRHSEVLVPVLMVLSGISMPLAVMVSQAEPVRFDVFRLFFDFPNILPLFLTYGAFFVPFFFGALAIGILFTQYTELIGRLYFFNLLGSGTGAILAITSATVFEPHQLPALLAFGPIAAGAILGSRPPRMILALLGSASAILIATALLISPPVLVLSEYKSLSKTLLLPEASVAYKQPSPRGLIHVVSSPALRSAPGLSLRYKASVPPQLAVFSNGDWIGSVTTSADSLQLLNSTTLALPYELDHTASALILDAGTGMRVGQALSNRIGMVTAVESHDALIALVKNELAHFNDSLFFQPQVHLSSLDSRTFLLGDTSFYDIISLPLLESFGGTSGLFAVQEQFLLTRESFNEMWERLTPDGALNVSTWIDHPPRTSLRVLATLVALLEERGIGDASKHLAAIKSWGTITFVAKKSQLRPLEIQRILQLCDRLSFDPLLLPGLKPSERDRFNLLTDADLNHSIDSLLSGNKTEFFDSYPFRIFPTTDERPYFSQFLKWNRLPATIDLVGQAGLPFLEVGYLLLLLTAMQIVVLAVILVFLPLVRLTSSRTRWTTFLYFSSLGIGYLLVEIILIQQFTLYWGHPVLAATSVIGILLTVSGFGSLFSSRLPLTQGSIRKTGVFVAVFLFAFAFFLTPSLRGTIASPPAMKLLLTLCLLSPVSFGMGMMFPLGLRVLGKSAPDEVPWAWGINGTMAVVAGALSVLLLVELGSSAVILISSGCYALAVAVTFFRR